MHRVVNGKFHHWQELAPIRKRMDVSSKDLLEETIRAFCLTICFRMVRGRHLKARSECFEQGSPEFSSEPWVSVRDEFTRQPMKTKDRVNKNTSTFRCLIDSGTSTRCTILLNLQTNTRIPVFLCGSAGNPKTKSIETDSQHSAGMISVSTAHEVEDQTSLVDILCMRGRTYARTDTGGASKSRD